LPEKINRRHSRHHYQNTQLKLNQADLINTQLEKTPRDVAVMLNFETRNNKYEKIDNSQIIEQHTPKAPKVPRHDKSRNKNVNRPDNIKAQPLMPQHQLINRFLIPSHVWVDGAV
jgi:exosome complex RNA-binding protein Rrp4